MVNEAAGGEGVRRRAGVEAWEDINKICRSVVQRSSLDFLPPWPSWGRSSIAAGQCHLRLDTGSKWPQRGIAQSLERLEVQGRRRLGEHGQTCLFPGSSGFVRHRRFWATCAANKMSSTYRAGHTCSCVPQSPFILARTWVPLHTNIHVEHSPNAAGSPVPRLSRDISKICSPQPSRVIKSDIGPVGANPTQRERRRTDAGSTVPSEHPRQ